MTNAPTERTRRSATATTPRTDTMDVRFIDPLFLPKVNYKLRTLTQQIESKVRAKP